MSGATQLREGAEAIAAATPDVAALTPAERLRQPFPPSQIGLLPQPYKKDSPKGNCAECGKWHGLPAMHLDFVGHGAVTDRLLDVDPEWTWEPFALDDHGLPLLDRFGNLWIRLTINGVTRPGVGDGPSMKVCIGDALRNAAMRFGVALDLWIRGQEDDPGQAGESLPEPEIVWNAGMVKARLVELLGDKGHAKEAWTLGHGDDLTEFSPEVADRLAEEWTGNQPADEPEADA